MGASRIGLVLTGGGARAAYQIGVLKAFSELLDRPERNPFAILCGTSAGAVNAVGLATRVDHFAGAVDALHEVWRNFRAQQVYRTDRAAVIRSGLRWLGMAAQVYRRNPVSLLDNSPLAALIGERFDFERMRANLANGAVEAVAINASAYGSGSNVTFYERTSGSCDWNRPLRTGLATPLTVAHLLASTAIPFVFPAVKLGGDFFGDGAMRQMAPISPALHLGADRVVVVGTGGRAAKAQSVAMALGEPATARAAKAMRYPSIAQIAGHALSSIFLDSLEQDIEWLDSINKLVRATPAPQRQTLRFREVAALVLEPSTPIEHIAAQHSYSLPRTIRFLLRPLGGMNRGGATMTSYLLFEPGFINALVELGFTDTMARHAEVLAFLRPDAEN